MLQLSSMNNHCPYSFPFPQSKDCVFSNISVLLSRHVDESCGVVSVNLQQTSPILSMFRPTLHNKEIRRAQPFLYPVATATLGKDLPGPMGMDFSSNSYI